MTSIGGFLSAAGLAAERSLSKLGAGEAVQARVLGATRGGLSVLIGQQSFQLDGPSNLAEARTLILQGIPSSSSERRVQIIALDDRPLLSPVSAKLVSRSQATSSVESTIVQKNQLQVVAQPVDADGKAQGQRVTLNLQAERSALTPQTQTGSAPVSAPAIAARPDGSQAASLQAIERNGRVLLSSTPAGPPQSDDARAPTSGFVPIGPARPAGGASIGNGLSPSLSPASAKTAEVRSSTVDVIASEIGRKGDLSRPGQTSATPMPSIDGEALPPRTVVASALSTYRTGLTYGSQAPPSVPSQPVSTGESQAATDLTRPDAGRAMKAVVIARTDIGQVVLQAVDRHFRVEQPIDLPIGTTLQASLVAGATIASASFTPSMSDGETSPLAKLIALLDSIDQAGRQSDMPGKQELQRQLPVPDKHLASRLLNLATTAGTDGQAEAGQRPSSDQGALTPSPRDQVQALVRDLASAASESLTDGWKSLTLPIGYDPAQAVCCYFRHHALDPDEDGSEGGDDQSDDAERAVFDVSLSQLGRCQIDALCRERRFDLLIRTEKQLPETDRQDIASLFRSASEIAGMNGDIGFKVGGFFEPVRWSASARDLRT